jgi:demethylmenaquinone methyltransferase/2-methoxy-6-polyprenyl-1,4-benzoquinol methylase
MIDYYAKRANEYEEIYLKQERQEELLILKEHISHAFENTNVLEIACGTGYWTEIIAQRAESIFATDYNSEVIEIAKNKNYKKCRVNFAIADAYSLSNISNEFSACFLGFWWSHIPKQKINSFVEGLHSHLVNCSKVLIIDNCYVEKSSTSISRIDENGNSFQTRKLKDGSEHEVLKNFPTDGEIISNLSLFSNEIKIKRMKYYWLAEYRIN